MEVAAIDIGGTKLAMGIVHEGGQIIASTVIPTPKKPEDGLGAVNNYVKTNWGAYDIGAIGVGAPAVVGGENGGYFLPNPSNLAAWGNFNLKKNLDQLIYDSVGKKVPLSIESDVYPATAAELLVRKSLFGDLKSHSLFPFFYLTISTGVGGEQAIMDGTTWKIYREL